MISIDPGNTYDSWRSCARVLLSADIPPEEVLFTDEPNLFEPPLSPSKLRTFSIPPEFPDLAKPVSCHVNPDRWNLLYRILWRIVKNGERNLCLMESDPDTSRARTMRKNISREIHKMHAFVRFKLIETDRETGREFFAAWIEPEHSVIELASPFFVKRFANMDWCILSPKGCAHWDGETLRFSEGISYNPFSSADSLEENWKTYYRSIFNPARLKTKMMQTEMPKKYWKNLPEAELIDELIAESGKRVEQMHQNDLRPVKKAPKNAYLDQLRKLPRSPEKDS